ncbi:28546_t:CDS:2 [Gigaspora margarita]|uniref:28546_t:CDS:1 n=1 Tax=Gigaspora margarita TaxID=4874 RepID=A0ABN7V406_GIGMA|nr:28546_t:CDS:2 [Gigaspora margarita]
MRKVQNRSDYSPSSLTNAYNCLSNYISKYPNRCNTFTINNKHDFSLLWEALNRKMKALKKSGKVTKHHNPLTSEELKMIFNHKALDIDGNLDSLVIPVPTNSEGYLEPIHDLKLYLNKRPENCKCEFLHLQVNKNTQEYSHGIWYIDAKLGVNMCNNMMKNICTDVKINIENYNIVNHSGRTTPIIFLFYKGILIVTSMSITGHKTQDLHSNNNHGNNNDNTIYEHNSNAIYNNNIIEEITGYDTTEEIQI